MFSPVGFGGATVKISPPLVITEAAIQDSCRGARRGVRRSAGRADRDGIERTLTSTMSNKPQVTIVGGGMITHDQILPSLYQMQRLGRIGEITVCASRRSTVEALAKAEGIATRFPGQSFRALSGLGRSRTARSPTSYRKRDRAHAAAPDRDRGGARSVAL